jgi:hypothetical protein
MRTSGRTGDAARYPLRARRRPARKIYALAEITGATALSDCLKGPRMAIRKCIEVTSPLG